MRKDVIARERAEPGTRTPLLWWGQGPVLAVGGWTWSMSQPPANFLPYDRKHHLFSPTFPPIKRVSFKRGWHKLICASRHLKDACVKARVPGLVSSQPCANFLSNQAFDCLLFAFPLFRDVICIVDILTKIKTPRSAMSVIICVFFPDKPEQQSLVPLSCKIQAKKRFGGRKICFQREGEQAWEDSSCLAAVCHELPWGRTGP